MAAPRRRSGRGLRSRVVAWLRVLLQAETSFLLEQSPFCGCSSSAGQLSVQSFR